MKNIHSPKLEEFLKQYDLEECISFMRAIFKFTYTKSRGEDGVYIWYGDRDWDKDDANYTANVGYCSFYFINYTEDQVIQKYTRYYNLKAFL